ncbi:MAG: DUF2059 domain-containing protein [Geobacteraceae bacterium]
MPVSDRGDYSQVFPKDEICQLAHIYQTPLGMNMLEKMPVFQENL